MVHMTQLRVLTSLPLKRQITSVSLLMVALVLSSLQDLLEALRNSHPFYLSESMLFNIVWLLFGPIAFIQLRLFTRADVLSGKLSGLFRTIAFVISSSVLHLIIFSMLVWVLSVVFFDHTYTFMGNFTYSLSQDLDKYLFGYGAIALIGLSNHPAGFTYQPSPITPPQETNPDRITVLSGRTTVVVSIRDIILIRSDAPYLRIHTSDKMYLHTQTLKAISQQLDPRQFVRVHKSTIVNVEHVTSYRSRLNGDYDLLLDDQTEVRLSRHYVAYFRQRMASGASL